MVFASNLLDLDNIQFGAGITPISFDGELNTPIGIGSNRHKVGSSGNAGSEKASSERRGGRTCHEDRLFKENSKDVFKGSSVTTGKRRHREIMSYGNNKLK
jgi:hypothetical protein